MKPVGIFLSRRVAATGAGLPNPGTKLPRRMAAAKAPHRIRAYFNAVLTSRCIERRSLAWRCSGFA